MEININSQVSFNKHKETLHMKIMCAFSEHLYAQTYSRRHSMQQEQIDKEAETHWK